MTEWLEPEKVSNKKKCHRDYTKVQNVSQLSCPQSKWISSLNVQFLFICHIRDTEQEILRMQTKKTYILNVAYQIVEGLSGLDSWLWAGWPEFNPGQWQGADFLHTIMSRLALGFTHTYLK